MLPERFLELFPEFSEETEPQLLAVILQVQAESGGYLGLNLEQREIALSLHIAHELKLGQYLANGYPTVPKSEKSNNDSVTYNSPDPNNSLATTNYGVRLQRIIKNSMPVARLCF